MWYTFHKKYTVNMYFKENFVKKLKSSTNNLAIINANFHDQEEHLLTSAFQVPPLPHVSKCQHFCYPSPSQKC